MDQENKILIGYKPELNYIDDYSSEIDNQLIDYDTNSYPDEDKDESIDDLLEREEDSVKKEEIVKTNDEDEIDDDEADLFSLIDSMYEEKGE